nr:hypothetical protein [Desulforamulus aquiferis]
MISILSIFTAFTGKGYLGLMTMWLSTLREYIQKLSLKAASNSFSNILIKRGNRISVVKGGRLQHLLPGDVVPGDIAVFKRGDCVPVEGEVISGGALLIPGEKVAPGQLLDAGSILEKGSLTVKVHRVVGDTSLSRLADILDDAIQHPEIGSESALAYAERLLPITFLTTALVFLFTRNFERTLAVLLAGAPGPAGLAAPAAFSAATSVGAGLV